MRITNRFHLTLIACLIHLTASAATTWHVATNGLDTNDGFSWDTPLLTISNAVAKASPTGGDTVLVSNGTYLVTEEIVVTTNHTVLGVNGREVTIVARDPAFTNRLFNLRGRATVAGLTLSDGFLYASNTLAYTNALWGAGVFMTDATLSNCVVTGCRILQTHSNVLGGGGGIFMSSVNALVVDCLISNNACIISTTNLLNANGSNKMGGGGIFLDRGTVTNCTIATNTFAHIAGNANGHSGGGGINVYGNGGLAYVMNCRIVDNVCDGRRGWEGGGAIRMGQGVVEKCLIARNVSYRRGAIMVCAGEGGGGGTAYIRQCQVISNRCPAASNYGGVSAHLAQGTVVGFENCLFADNIGPYDVNIESSGIAWYMRNCTFAGTGITYSIYRSSGSLGPVSLENCVIAGAITNATRTTPWTIFTSCCAYSTNASLFPAGTSGNITNNPEFVNAPAGDYHLPASSPCVDAGLNQPWMVTARDLDGTNSRVVNGTVDMGSYEYWDGSLNGSFLAVPGISLAPATNVFTAFVSDPDPASLYYRWDFESDGIVDQEGTGRTIVTNCYTNAGYYTPALTVSNGVGDTSFFTAYVKAGPVTYYVSTNGANAFPYTNWIVAAPNLPPVWSLLTLKDTIRVGPGTYIQPEAQLPNLTIPATIVGEEGAAKTIVTKPYAGIFRLFQLGHAGITLDGFTIANGRLTAANNDGGGLSITAGLVRNCIVSNCYATRYGGGIYLSSGGTSRNCLVTRNISVQQGGGITLSGPGRVENCTIVGNTASNGGGGLSIISPSASMVFNSIVYDNVGVLSNANWQAPGTVNYAFTNSCTTPLTGLPGTGNISDNPLFVNAAAGNYRLASGSPCWNTGTNQNWMTNAMDLDGSARILFGQVDRGAYESTAPRATGALIVVR